MNLNISAEVRKPNINARNVHIFHLQQDQVKNNPCIFLLNFAFMPSKNLFEWIL